MPEATAQGSSYPDISGFYTGSETAKIVAAAAGETETETISGSNSVTIIQTGSAFQYTIKDPQSGLSITRKGTLTGNVITLDPQPIALLAKNSGLVITTNRVTSGGGTVSNGRIDIETVGEVLGTYLSIPFRMDITSTVILYGSVIPVGPPAISSHPSDQSVQEPAAAAFSVVAVGSPAPSYQWQRRPGGTGSWGDLTDGGSYGATRTANLSIDPTAVDMTGDQFRCVVQNAEGSVTSAVATLTVTAPPVLPEIEKHPDGASVWVGATITFSVEATDPTGLIYQWQKDGADIPGATLSTFSLVSALSADAGSYRCKVSNLAGEVTSDAAVLEVVLTGIPSVVQDSGPAEVTAGDEVTFEVIPSGSSPLSYQWSVNGVEIPGATDATYTVPSAQFFHMDAVSVAVVNEAGTRTNLGVPLVVAAADDSPSRILNLSTRGITLTGDNVMIPGFVVSGTGSKKMLIRVVGPRLGDFGVTGSLADPQLELWRNLSGGGAEIVESNDNWLQQSSGGSREEIISTAIQTGAFDFAADVSSSALVVEVSAGSYGVVSKGANDTTGVVAAEIYDADDASSDASLVNLSNRGFVGIGEAAMIPGFVISNEGPKTFLIRAVGPTLIDFGINGVLEDPTLSIYRRTPEGEELILTNDNWQENPVAEMTSEIAASLGAFALGEGSLDAAMVVTLLPGVYSAVCTGVGEGTGIAIVEIYVVSDTAPPVVTGTEIQIGDMPAAFFGNWFDTVKGSREWRFAITNQSLRTANRFWAYDKILDMGSGEYEVTISSAVGIRIYGFRELTEAAMEYVSKPNGESWISATR